MKTVLVFTNPGSWQGIDETVIDRVIDLWNTHATEDLPEMSDYPSRFNPIVKCVEIPDAPVRLVPVMGCDSEGVYLVYDKIDASLFEKIMAQTQDDDSYILVHSQGWNNNNPGHLIPPGDFRFVREGLHEKSHDYLYTPVFELLTDNHNEKMGRIIKLLKPPASKELREAALRFFDGCMTPYNRSDSFMNAYHKLLKDSELTAAVKDFYEHEYEGNDYKQYFNAFKTFSDKVLTIILARENKEK